MRSKPDSAIFYAGQAYQLAAKDKYYWGMGRSLAFTGRTYELIGTSQSNIEAVKYFTRAVELFQQSKDTVDYYNQYTSLRSLASIKALYNEFDQSRTYYTQALEALELHLKAYPDIAKKYNDYALVPDIKLSIAQLVKNKGDLRQAANLFLELDSISTSNKMRAQVFNQLGLTYMGMNNSMTADYYFKQAHEMKGADSLIIARAFHNRGRIAFRDQQYLQAISFYVNAVEIKDVYQKASKLDRFNSYLDLGEALYAANQKTRAVQVWEKALTIVEDITPYNDFHVVYNWLENAYRDIDPAKSMAYDSLYVNTILAYNRTTLELSDSLENTYFTSEVSSYFERQSLRLKKDQERKQWIYALVITFLTLLILHLLRVPKAIKRAVNKYQKKIDQLEEQKSLLRSSVDILENMRKDSK